MKTDQRLGIFRAWIDSFPGENTKQRATAAGASIGFSYVYMHAILAGNRRITSTVAAAIHDQSGGRFHRDSLLFGAG